MKYNVYVPPTDEMGNYRCIANNRKDALWDYNSAREHDGLPPLKRMPRGTVYTRVE